MKSSRSRKRSNALTRALPFPFTGGGAGILFLLLACGLLLGVSSFQPEALSGIRQHVTDAAAPMLKTISVPVQSAAMMVRDMTGISQLQAENIRLQKENERLREWYQAALYLESENKSLRTLLNVQEEAPQRFITARILTDSGNRFVKTMLVGAGAGDQVRKGQAVLAGDGLIGRIIEVGDKVSRVLLLTDINSRIPVQIQSTGDHAILTGNNGPLLDFKLLGKDAAIGPGARIVTSGEGGMLPPGMPIGQSVLLPKGEAKVALFTDLSKIVYVRIVDAPEQGGLQRIETAP